MVQIQDWKGLKILTMKKYILIKEKKYIKYKL